MSLARAFTKRGKRSDSSTTPSPAWSPRTLNTKASNANIDRAKISSPVELISTTNMLSYNAPDLPRRQMSSSSSTISHSSADDSDRSSSSNMSRETLTDASSVESSPTSIKPSTSGYFPPTKAARRSSSSVNLHRKSMSLDGVPAIPQRALSHSKQAHEQLARKRSLHHMSSSARHSREHRISREQRSSMDIFRGSVEPGHPFGKELEQLNEVVEEFHGVIRDAAMDEDLSLMREKGLVRLCAADYLNEIEPLFMGMFETRLLTVNAAWI